jgi:hypothetical protein
MMAGRDRDGPARARRLWPLDSRKLAAPVVVDDPAPLASSTGWGGIVGTVVSCRHYKTRTTETWKAGREGKRYNLQVTMENGVASARRRPDLVVSNVGISFSPGARAVSLASELTVYTHEQGQPVPAATTTSQSGLPFARRTSTRGS